MSRQASVEDVPEIDGASGAGRGTAGGTGDDATELVPVSAGRVDVLEDRTGDAQAVEGGPSGAVLAEVISVESSVRLDTPGTIEFPGEPRQPRMVRLSRNQFAEVVEVESDTRAPTAAPQESASVGGNEAQPAEHGRPALADEADLGSRPSTTRKRSAPADDDDSSTRSGSAAKRVRGSTPGDAGEGPSNAGRRAERGSSAGRSATNRPRTPPRRTQTPPARRAGAIAGRTASNRATTQQPAVRPPTQQRARAPPRERPATAARQVVEVRDPGPVGARRGQVQVQARGAVGVRHNPDPRDDKTILLDEAVTLGRAGEPLNQRKMADVLHRQLCALPGFSYPLEGPERCDGCRDAGVDPCDWPSIEVGRRGKNCLRCAKMGRRCTSNNTGHRAEMEAARVLRAEHGFSTIQNGGPLIFARRPTLYLRQYRERAAADADAAIELQRLQGAGARVEQLRNERAAEEAELRARAAEAEARRIEAAERAVMAPIAREMETTRMRAQLLVGSARDIVAGARDVREIRAIGEVVTSREFQAAVGLAADGARRGPSRGSLTGSVQEVEPIEELPRDSPSPQ